jgi:glycosyltransferase involved in cell wall biosynthesis
MCDQYATQDSRINVVHKINGGLSSARNAGLDIALGEYVTFVDSDDYVREDYVEVLYNALKKTNSQISVGNYLTVHTDESKKNDFKLNEPLQIYSSFEAVFNLYEHSRGLLLQFTTVWGNLYDIQLFKNLRFPFGKNHEDEFLNYKLFFLTKNIVYSSEKIYYYLIRKDSFMQSEYNLSKLAKLEAIEERVLFFENIKQIILKNKSLYLNYHQLLYHSCKIKSIFPDEKGIYKSLQEKHQKLSKELLINNGLNLKEKFIIFLFFLFPKLYKYKP